MLLVAALLVGCASRREVDPNVRPDVLLVTIDTVRVDEMGYYRGAHPAPTARLDAFAKQSRVFLQGWSATNMTVPSHGVLLSGLDAPLTGLRSNADAPSATLLTLPRTLRAAGWATVGSVGMDVLSHEFATDFDQWVRIESGEHRSTDVATSFVDELGTVPAGQPVFGWAHFFDAHAPYAPTDAWLARTWHGDVATGPAPWANAPLPPTMRNHPLLAKNPGVDWIWALRAAELGAVDDAFGRVLDAMEARAHPLIVVVVGDHGESLGEGGVWFNHAGVNAVNFHVPFLLRADGVPAGRVDGLVTHVDVAPTLLRLAGVKVPPELHGCDLAGPEGATGCGRDHLVLDDRHPPQTGGAVVRAGRWFGRWGNSDYGPAHDDALEWVGGVWQRSADTTLAAEDDALLRARQAEWQGAPTTAAGATHEQLQRLGYEEP